MTEEQRPFLSDEEAKDKFLVRLVKDPELNKKFFNAYMADPKATVNWSYLEWCWDHKDLAREGGEKP